ncbi:hypothetical protein GYMLUDRAFT_642212 [Collybiopsis luxurians FD-317 M1]|nr:hypothetical protein GYMLUDRAFT_642212 [Collybiopsis luxurians FD-317 M1]
MAYNNNYSYTEMRNFSQAFYREVSIHAYLGILSLSSLTYTYSVKFALEAAR